MSNHGMNKKHADQVGMRIALAVAEANAPELGIRQYEPSFWRSPYFFMFVWLVSVVIAYTAGVLRAS